MKRKKDFIMQKVVGENILVPIGAQVMDMNGLVTLNDTAAYVWDLLAQERSKDELFNAVIARFDVDSVTARTDLQTFLDEITKIGLLEP